MHNFHLIADAIPSLDAITDFDVTSIDEFIKPDASANNKSIFKHWIFTSAIPAWISYAISLSVAIAILLIVVSGIYLMLSPEDEELKTKAIDTIKWSIVGLIIIMLSYTIVEIINNIKFDSGTNPDIAIHIKSQKELDNLAKGDLRSEIIPEIIKTILKLMGTLAFLLFIYAGVIMVLRDGDQEKVTKAKQILKYSVIGAVVALTAYLVVEAVINFDFS
jgi:cbb3-type cytochrome oxidase subunit 3